MSIQTLARATNSSNLEMEEGVVHDVDRLTAMAGGDALGGLLLRYRDADQKQWGKKIVYILAHRVMRKYKLTRDLVIRLCTLALHEFAHSHCTTCNGARVLIVDEKKVICPACGGSGVELFTDLARRQFIGTYGRQIDYAITYAHASMSVAVGNYAGRAAWKLT